MAAELRSITTAQPTTDVVDVLEEFLELAKTGKIVAIGICAIDREDNVIRQTANGTYACGKRDMVGATAALYDMALRSWLDR